MNTHFSVPPVRRVAMLSVHTCPLAMLGGKKTGGMNVYVRDLGRELSRQGIQVDVFTRSQDSCQPMVCHDLGHGSRVIHIPAGPEEPIPVIEVANYIDEFAQGVLDFASEGDIEYDVIHAHYWLSGLVGERLRAAWGGVPVVSMFHTLGHMKNTIARDESQMAPAERLMGEAEVVALSDRLVAATPAEYEQLAELYDAPIHKIDIVPPGVDLERFYPMARKVAKRRIGINCGHKTILFAGRIEPLKGVDTLLRAIAIVRERHPDAISSTCLAIVGGDPWAENPDAEMKRLLEMRDELGLEELVTFVGAKDQNVLPNYYAAAEMLVMPSHYESFGMVALEAMAMGTPVIASEVGGLAHLVQDGINGFHTPSGDAEALAHRIHDLLLDDNCRLLLSIQAREYAKEYDWARIARRIRNVYRSALADREIVSEQIAEAPLPCC